MSGPLEGSHLNEFSLSTPGLQNALINSVQDNCLAVAVREEQIILCIGRAYRSIGHSELPEIKETHCVYIPFYVVTDGEFMRTVPGVGLTNRLMLNYQFKVVPSDSGSGVLDKFNAMDLDVPLEYVLNIAGEVFTDNPTRVRIMLVNVPFYRVTVTRGSSVTEILINAYNGDLLLEQPPPQATSNKLKSTVSTAVFIFAGLVCVITGTYMFTRSLSMTGIVTLFAFWITRNLAIRNESDVAGS